MGPELTDTVDIPGGIRRDATSARDAVGGVRSASDQYGFVGNRLCGVFDGVDCCEFFAFSGCEECECLSGAAPVAVAG